MSEYTEQERAAMVEAFSKIGKPFEGVGTMERVAELYFLLGARIGMSYGRAHDAARIAEMSESVDRWTDTVAELQASLAAERAARERAEAALRRYDNYFRTPGDPFGDVIDSVLAESSS